MGKHKLTRDSVEAKLLRLIAQSERSGADASRRSVVLDIETVEWIAKYIERTSKRSTLSVDESGSMCIAPTDEDPPVQQLACVTCGRKVSETHLLEYGGEYFCRKHAPDGGEEE